MVQTYSTYPMQSDDAVQRETFDQLQDLAQFHLPDGIIFDASDFNYIDTMGIQSLKQVSLRKI